MTGQVKRQGARQCRCAVRAVGCGLSIGAGPRALTRMAYHPRPLSARQAMSNFEQQKEKFRTQPGFIAALDQSGGSTPKALKLYGIAESAYSGDAQMMDLIHAMRTRIITSPAFNGDRILAAILFEATMDREVLGRPDGRVPVGGQEGRPDPQGRQGARRGGERRAADEADAGSRQAARAREGQGHLRHQDAFGDQAGQRGRHPGRRRPAVRGRPADHRGGPRADHRARGRHQVPGQGGGRGPAQGGDPGAARQAAGGPAGDAEAHDPGPGQPLRGPASRTRAC